MYKMIRNTITCLISYYYFFFIYYIIILLYYNYILYCMLLTRACRQETPAFISLHIQQRRQKETKDLMTSGFKKTKQQKKKQRISGPATSWRRSLLLCFISAWLKCGLFKKKRKKKSILQNNSVPEATLTRPRISHQHTNSHLQTWRCPIM